MTDQPIPEVRVLSTDWWRHIRITFRGVLITWRFWAVGYFIRRMDLPGWWSGHNLIIGIGPLRFSFEFVRAVSREEQIARLK